MDIKEQVKKWVEKKLEKVINKDLKEKVVEENSTIDVEMYVNYLLNKYFSDEEVEDLKELLFDNSYYDMFFTDSENSSEDQNSVNESIELEANEYQAYSVDEIIKNLRSSSEDVQKKYLKVLESCAEDLINQNVWHKINEILQKMLNKTQSGEIRNLALQVYQKPLRCHKKPQIFSKGFSSVAEVLTNQINRFNLNNCPSFEEIYDIKEDKWLREKKFISPVQDEYAATEIIIKLMWLLIDSQQQIPSKWVGFNEARFREIIFSFIRLLSSTSLENKNLSGLEVLSVLNPGAGWCRFWCHTALGRNLLSSALRKYRSFFIHIIENILSHMKAKKSYRLPSIRDNISLSKISPTRGDDISEASTISRNRTTTQREENKEKRPTSEEGQSSRNTKLENTKTSSTWILENIPKEIVAEAVFFHSVSFMSCLIQFRSGQALFPVQTVTRKRLLSVQDLSLSMIQYLENIEWDNVEIPFTSAYKAKIIEMLHVLRMVKTRVNSSRMSKNRQHFSYPF